MRNTGFKTARKGIIASFLALTLSCMSFVPVSFAQENASTEVDVQANNTYASATPLVNGKAQTGSLTTLHESEYFSFKTSKRASVYECRFDALSGSWINLDFTDSYAQGCNFYELSDLVAKKKGKSSFVTKDREVCFASGLKKNANYYVNVWKLGLHGQNFRIKYIEHPILTKINKVKATKKTNSAVKIAWSKQANAQKYQVQYRLPGKAWKSVIVKGNTAVIKNLKKNTSYQVRVRPYCANAYDKATNSLRSWGSYSKVWTCKTAK